MEEDNKAKFKKIAAAEVLEDAVRTVGTFKPKFNPSVAGKVFSDELNVLGTAFWLREYKVLITCAHVVAEIIRLPLELAGLLVIGNHGNYQRATVGVVDYLHDLAVLNLVDSNTGVILNDAIISVESEKGLILSSEYPETGLGVAWAGYPLGNQLLNQIHNPTYSEGVVGISKRDNQLRKDIQISGVVVGGYSGSPVIDRENNKLIGVVSNGPQNSGIFMAVSWEHVKALSELARFHK